MAISVAIRIRDIQEMGGQNRREVNGQLGAKEPEQNIEANHPDAGGLGSWPAAVNIKYRCSKCKGLFVEGDMVGTVIIADRSFVFGTYSNIFGIYSEKCHSLLGLAREVIKGMRENAYQAKFNGGWVPLGYDVIDGRYLVNEMEARVIRLIFSMFLEGHGYNRIQDKLNELGYQTKQGKPFGKNSIYEILRNTKYAGCYVFNRAPRRLNGKRNWRSKKDESEIISVPGAIPAIIPEEDFIKVQEIMDGRKKTGPRQKGEEIYFLTGKVVCGECGAAMVGNSSRRKAGAEPTRYYECNRKMRTRDCRSKRIPKEYLENYVIDKIEQNMFTSGKLPELARKMVALVKEKDKHSVQEEQSTRVEMSELEKKIGNLVRAIENGADYEILSGRIRVLKNRMGELQVYLDLLKSPVSDLSEEMVLKYLSALQGSVINRLDQLAEKKIVDLYVHEIKAFPDKVDVILKFDFGADKNGVGGGT